MECQKTFKKKRCFFLIAACGSELVPVIFIALQKLKEQSVGLVRPLDFPFSRPLTCVSGYIFPIKLFSF